MTGDELPNGGTTAREALEMHLVQALTRCELAAVRDHLEAAIRHCRDLPPTPLVECPLCGSVGLPERIRIHDCSWRLSCD